MGMTAPLSVSPSRDLTAARVAELAPGTVAKVQGPPTDPDAFVAWAEGRAGRWELANGVVTVMVGGTRAHEMFISELAFQLQSRIDRAQWVVLTAGLAVRPQGSTRYPDIMVEPRGGSLRGLVATGPVLIVEVLSPSTQAVDFGAKVREYTSLESLQAYLVADPDAPHLWLWQRNDAGTMGLTSEVPGSSPGSVPASAMAEPELVFGRDAVLRVPALGLELPLAMLYPEPRETT